jgi:hypothetical protein
MIEPLIKLYRFRFNFLVKLLSFIIFKVEFILLVRLNLKIFIHLVIFLIFLIIFLILAFMFKITKALRNLITVLYFMARLAFIDIMISFLIAFLQVLLFKII